MFLSGPTDSDCTSSERGLELPKKAEFDLDLGTVHGTSVSYHGKALPAGQMKTAVVTKKLIIVMRVGSLPFVHSCSPTKLRYYL